MKTLPLTEAKSRLSGLVDRVRKLDEPILITKNGRPAAVLVSPDEFDSWRETEEILRDPVLMKELRKALRDFESGKTRVHTLDELFG